MSRNAQIYSVSRLHAGLISQPAVHTSVIAFVP